jgi:Ca-activated chloride channel family protein
VSAKKFNIITILLAVMPANIIWAASAQTSVRSGNKMYADGNYNQAINHYDQALVESPAAAEPKFDKADSYYRLDDLANAITGFTEVATESKDMELVEKAKYNLGNCHFQQGTKQKDSDLQKALDEYKTSIGYWRQVLDINPKNEKAAKNIEVARLIIKDLLDQINKQKKNDANQPQEPNKPQEPNQPQKQQQNQQQQKQQEREQKGASGEPNKPQQEPNQPQKKQGEQKKEQNQKQVAAPQTTPEDILDKEQRQRKERQMLQRGEYQKVDKDW